MINSVDILRSKAAYYRTQGYSLESTYYSINHFYYLIFFKVVNDEAFCGKHKVHMKLKQELMRLVYGKR